MGKSIRSKIKKRLRTAKRQRVDAMICTPREEEHFASLQKVMNGTAVTLLKPRNAFLYPNAPDAVFAQHTVMKPIDFRSSNLPMASYAFRGNRRQYSGEQADHMKVVAKTHPKMEIMAGGGAVMGTTGVHVTKLQAEITATTIRNPEAAANAASVASAASAVEAAMAEDVEAVEAPVEPEKEPDNKVDHSRRPIIKDELRSKRTAEHKPRAKATQKKAKAPTVGAKVVKKDLKKADSKMDV